MARRVTLEFLKTESGSGLLLAAAAAVALAMANSPLAGAYFGFVDRPVHVRLAGFIEVRSIASWVKDGLMAVFFLVVGMQVKFEVLRGELSSPRRLGLPLLAALGGLVGPALVTLAIDRAAAASPGAWLTPGGVDLAFALAILAVCAPRLPAAVRVFLLTVAVADNVAVVALIGLLFTHHLDPAALAGAGVTLALLGLLSRWKRAPLLFYAVGFVLVWGFTLESGIDTCVAGLACALTVPVGARRPGQESVLRYFMDSLHPYVAFAILPLFAFTAAGFSFADVSAHAVLSAAPVGVALGLWIGKPLGIFAFAFLGAAARLGRRPAGATWNELLGVALLCGAGFTLSLYIAEVAAGPGPAHGQALARLAVLAGSLLAMLGGGMVLARAQAIRDEAPAEEEA